MYQKTLTVFVLAYTENERQLLAYDIEASQADVADGGHYEAAKARATQDGYHPIDAFDIFDKAGQQLIGKEALGGDVKKLAHDIVENLGNTTR